MFEILEDGVEAVLECVRLEQLGSGRGVEEKALSPRADMLFEHIRQARAKIDVPLPVLRFQVWLNIAALRLLPDVERAAILADVLADLEPESFPGPYRTTAGQECVEHAILSLSSFKYFRHSL